MNTLKSNAFQVTIVSILLFLSACTFTQSFKPDFNNNQDTVLKNIKTIYGFEDITFIGKTKSGNGGTHSSLMVKFINGKRIPTDTAKMADLEKRLGTQIKGIIKNPKQFETYVILLDSVVSTKGTLSNVTRENYTGHEFNYSDL